MAYFKCKTSSQSTESSGKKVIKLNSERIKSNVDQTFDVSSLVPASVYNNFTVNNFYIDIRSTTIENSSTSRSITSTPKTYSSSTGVLTVKKQIGSYTESSKTKRVTLLYDVYLIY